MESRKTKDYYAVLGVTSDCSTTEIKKAYHALAHRFHPDRVRASETATNASERMVEINEAFAVLSDAKRRAKFDRDLAAENNPTPPPPAESSSEGWDFPVPNREATPVPQSRRNVALDHSVAQEFLDKMKVQLLAEPMAVKLTEDSAQGWLWLLQGKGWRINYSVGARQFAALNANTAREGIAQVQVIVDKLRSGWKKNFFVFLLAFQSLSERDTVLKLLRTYCNREDNTTQKNLVNLVAVDLRQRQSVLCGTRTGDAQHNAILRALSVS